MNAVLVHAHPDPSSFNRLLLERASAGLQSAGHTCHIIDLYGIDYPAQMSREEHIAYSSTTPIVDPLVAAHADLIRSCDILVFVYPTWWSAMPAILKGWLERTLVKGIAFDFDERTGRLTPLLGNVRHLIGITTHGSPRWYVRIVGDNGRRTVMRTVRAIIGARVRTMWLAMYDLDSQPETERRAFLERVERTLAQVRI